MMKRKGEKGMGRPSKYDERLVEAILSSIANDLVPSTRATARRGVPFSTFCRWVSEDRDGLRNRYIEARECYFDALAEQCLEIADDGTNDYVERKRKDGSTYVALDSEHVQRSALRISTRKWLIEVGRPASTNYGKKAEDADALVRAEALAALERIAHAKATGA